MSTNIASRLLSRFNCGISSSSSEEDESASPSEKLVDAPLLFFDPFFFCSRSRYLYSSVSRRCKPCARATCTFANSTSAHKKDPHKLPEIQRPALLTLAIIAAPERTGVRSTTGCRRPDEGSLARSPKPAQYGEIPYGTLKASTQARAPRRINVDRASMRLAILQHRRPRIMQKSRAQTLHT